jgi:hypothetical protein
MDTPNNLEPTQELLDAQARKVWGTYTVHLRNGMITHTVLRETRQPSSDPRLASQVMQHPQAQEARESGEDRELIYARVRDNKLTLIAIEHHRIRTPNNGAEKKDQHGTRPIQGH